MNNIERILQTHFPIANWTIHPSRDGQPGRCYVAESEGLKVFIKSDVAVAVLRRLSEIGVAPRVLAAGVEHDRSYVIQEYIAGRYPDWRWFASHLSLLATFVRRYHDDQGLAALLSQDAPTHFDEHVARDLKQLERRFQVNEALVGDADMALAFGKLREQAKRLQPVALAPVHVDPNTKNILLVGDSLLMVDWDDALLSDPVRDVGLLLWWYVAKQQWAAFFEAYGLPLDEAVMQRMYWWTARTSFAGALWQVEHGYDGKAFFADFVAALQGEDNPRAVYHRYR